MKRWSISWDFGSIEIQSMGCMVSSAEFRIPGSGPFSPFYSAHWDMDDPRMKGQPGIMKHLSGEWPCVPFGAARHVEGLVESWSGLNFGGDEEWPHGYSSNNDWHLIEMSPDQLVLGIDYPEDSPVRSLKRTVKPEKKSTAIDFELSVNFRNDVFLPIALHPTFRLPEKALSVKLLPGHFDFGVSFPGVFESGSSILATGNEFSSLEKVPLVDGGYIDLSRLPLEANTENLVQLCGISGFELHYEDEGRRVRIDWEKEHFPSCVLWMSNRGRSQYPWDSKNLALGIEPVNSAFDLGTKVSTSENPISRSGISTYMNFSKNQTWKTSYRISVL